MTFRLLDLFPSSDKGKDIAAPLGSIEMLNSVTGKAISKGPNRVGFPLPLLED
jgi:hypothetical protein